MRLVTKPPAQIEHEKQRWAARTARREQHDREIAEARVAAGLPPVQAPLPKFPLPVTIRMPVELRMKVEEEAYRRQVTMTVVMVDALLDYFGLPHPAPSSPARR